MDEEKGILYLIEVCHREFDDYWNFLGPPVYDTSRAGSFTYEPSIHFDFPPRKAIITVGIQSQLLDLSDSLDIDSGQQM